MKSKFILLVTWILLSISSYSQNEDSSRIRNITRLSFLDPGISFEFRIARCHSVYLQAYYNTSVAFAYDMWGDENQTVGYLDPAFTVQYRYYYNTKKRAGKNKRVAMNSQNYLGAFYEGLYTKRGIWDAPYSDEDERRIVNTVGALWGLQRNFADRFSIDFSLGLGYRFGRSTFDDYMGVKTYYDDSAPSINSQLSVGIWLNRRN